MKRKTVKMRTSEISQQKKNDAFCKRNKKTFLIRIILRSLLLSAIILMALICLCGCSDGPADDYADAKPVIYLYPQQEQNVSVQLIYEGELTCTYPQPDACGVEKADTDGPGGCDSTDGPKHSILWNVTASPDGHLLDSEDQSYNYLYWEGRTDTDYDFSEGFCVAGDSTAAFLEDALAQLGLTRREANEFIVYWLPLMQDNPYNLISFQQKAYTDHARLQIDPAPDTLLRVFMAWKPLENPVEIPEQTLTAPSRTGFTAVEWGGCEVE